MDQIQKQKNIDNAKKLRGYIQKWSPSLLVGYQKRYFMIVDDGSKLVYFKDEKNLNDPKGAIDIMTIDKIEDVNEKDFNIKYLDREFQLRAVDQQSKREWINSLNLLQQHLRRQSLDQQKQIIKQRTISAKQEMTDSSKSIDYTQKDAHRQIDKDLMKKIQLEADEKKQKEQEIQTKLLNFEVLKAKGLQNYLKKFDNNYIKQIMCSGFFSKKGQSQNSSYQKRWFFIISNRPILPDPEFPIDENTKQITEYDLPIELEFNVLYYYKYDGSNDSSTYKGKIRMEEIIDIVSIDQQQDSEQNILDQTKNLLVNITDKLTFDLLKLNQDGFHFKINQGDRVYFFQTEQNNERQMWLNALRTSQRIANQNKEIQEKIEKQQSNQIEGSTILATEIIDVQKQTYIDRIQDIFDKQQNQQDKIVELKKFIEKSILKIESESLKDSDPKESFVVLQFLINNQQKEFFDILQQCLQTKHKRIDIQKIYIDVYNEYICKNFIQFWEANYMKIDLKQLLEFAQLVDSYYKQLAKYALDNRIINGIQVLLNTYISKVVENMEPIVENIAQSEYQNAPSVNDQGMLISQSPIDLFKILNENFDQIKSFFKSKLMGQKLAFFAKRIILQYQELMDEYLDLKDFDQDQLTAVCNNTIQFSSFVKSYANRLEDEYNLEESEIESYLDKMILLRQFVSIGNKSKDILLNFLFKNIDVFFQLYYLDLNTSDVLKDTINFFQQTIQKLHDSYYRKVWKNFLDKFVLNYVSALIISCGKGKKADITKIILKLSSDQKFLMEEFENLLFTSVIERSLKPLDDVKMVLTSNLFYVNLTYIKNLRVYFGPYFNINMIKLLYNIKGDISSSVKKSLVHAIEEDFQDVSAKESRDSKEKDDIDRSQIFQIFTDLLKQSGIEDEIQQQQEAYLKNKNAQKDIDLSSILDESNQKEQGQNLNQIRRASSFRKSIKHITESDLDIFQNKNQNVLEKKQLKGSSQPNDNIKINIFQDKGYLNKRADVKGTKSFWKKRYFVLNKATLYWYKDEQSTNVQNKLQLVDMSSCYPHNSKEKQFIIELKAKNTPQQYKFEADTIVDKQNWINSIQKKINEINGIFELQIQQAKEIEQNQEIEIIDCQKGFEPLFKDYEFSERREKIYLKISNRMEREAQRFEELEKVRNQKKAQQQPLILF